MADFKSRRLPLLTWLACAGVCAWLLTQRAGRLEYLALAQAMQYEISAAATGRLETVVVELYEEVDAGDVVARLDDAELVARIERSEATVRQLGAELEAARVSLLASNDQGRAAWRDELRRFQTEEEQRRLAVLEIGVRIESDEVELESRELDLTRAGSLLDDLLIPQAEYDRIRLWRDLVRRRLDESRALQDQTEQEYKVARARRQDYERGLPEQPGAEPLLRPLSEAMTVESERLREIRARREATVLRSPIAGQVNQILCRQGQTVVPGETILTVIDRNAGEIIAYLSESDDRQVRLDAPVLVSSLKRPEKSAESFVVRVGAGLQPLPERLWREPAVPDYGRAVVIAAVPNLPLSPGELLNVRFLDER